MHRENSHYFSPEKQEQLRTGDIELGEEGLNGLLKPCAEHFSMLLCNKNTPMESRSSLLYKRSLKIIWSHSLAQTMQIYIASALFGEAPWVLFFSHCLRRKVSIMVCVVFSKINILSPPSFIWES